MALPERERVTGGPETWLEREIGFDRKEGVHGVIPAGQKWENSRETEIDKCRYISDGILCNLGLDG